jgi:hypothetical protein
LFVKRCKDTAQDGRGFIVALDDGDIKKLLDLRNQKDIRGINNFLDTKYRELVM